MISVLSLHPQIALFQKIADKEAHSAQPTWCQKDAPVLVIPIKNECYP